jgi:hypothetical protein
MTFRGVVSYRKITSCIVLAIDKTLRLSEDIFTVEFTLNKKSLENRVQISRVN